MVQAVLDMLSEALRSIASGAVPVAIAIAGIVVLGALVVVVVGVFDRDRVRWMFAAIPLALRPLGGWILFVVALAAGVFVLHVVQLATDQRFVAMEYAQNTSGADSDATSMVQNAPRASFVSQKTYRRILTIPPYLLGRVSAEGVGVLAPYLTDPSAENVTRLVDSFRRSGRNVVFQRDATLQIETPIKLDASTVDANIELVDPTFGGRRTFYRASFDGKYVVHNATGREARVRFTFPLPTGSGTLSEVRFLADGKPIAVTDLSNGYVWDGTLPQDGKTTFEIAYRNQGARGWAYRLSGRREPIAKLDLAVHANRSPKFARYSLFPTTVSHGIAGGYTAEWHLENVVTAQDVGLVFARLDVRETLAKMLTYAPVALFVGIVFVAAYALRRRYHVTVGAGDRGRRRLRAGTRARRHPDVVSPARHRRGSRVHRRRRARAARAGPPVRAARRARDADDARVLVRHQHVAAARRRLHRRTLDARPDAGARLRARPAATREGETRPLR